ncbi:hypothetical protein [Nonomuraea sp. MG754425]|nr:hypothetical protein [Nonomuraea sp. MG754425]
MTVWQTDLGTVRRRLCEIVRTEPDPAFWSSYGQGETPRRLCP